MQERRTTIRVGRLSRAQYCPAEDPVPRDGRITDLSERGAGLLAHETHRVGARLTVSFSLPEEEELLTASGVVHWSDARVRQGHWYPLGLEWLPMEETARHRLHTFLTRRAPSRSLQVSGEKLLGPDLRLLFVRIALVLGALLAAGLAVWVFSLAQKNRALGEAVEQRNAIIRHVEQRGLRLEQALAEAATQLTAVSKAAAQFGQQSADLETEVGRLSGEVERFQESYVRVREEREQLIERVMALEQERVELTRQLSSIPALRLAIQEAVASRRSTQRQVRAQALKTRNATDRQYDAQDNRGYLVRNGRPTAAHSTIWIRVHDPEPLLTKSP